LMVTLVAVVIVIMIVVMVVGAEMVYVVESVGRCKWRLCSWLAVQVTHDHHCCVQDIDEAVFELVLPKSIQNSVAGTKLSCFGWLPAQFRVSDYDKIGKTMADEWPRETETVQWPLGYEKYKVLMEMHKQNPDKMLDPVFLKFFKDAAISAITETWEDVDTWMRGKNDTQ
jgi:hypothetical protein